MLKFYTFEKEVKPYINSETIENRKYFVLEIGNNRIVLSNPSIQPLNEFKCDSFKDVMYFYYNVDIQSKDDKEWKSIAENGVYDFPALPSLPDMISYMTSYDMKKDYNRREFLYNSFEKEESTTDYEIKKDMNLLGMLNEDEYSVTKYYRFIKDNYNPEKDTWEDTESIWYDLYVGVGNGDGRSTTGFKTTCLKDEDLIEIKLWAEKFLEYAIDMQKKIIDDWLNNIEKGDIEDDSEYEKNILEVYKFLRKENSIEETRNLLINLYDGSSRKFEALASEIRKTGTCNYERFLKGDENER